MNREKIKKLAIGGMLFAFFVFVTVFSKESRATLVSSMNFCVKTVLPSVFPFAVLGNLIGSSVAEFPAFLTRAVSKIFGVSEDGAKALLPGLFTGFPVGASGARGLYLREEISERELCRICAFSVTPGAAFVISGVGTGMFGSVGTGVRIYISVIVSVFLVGYLTRGRAKNDKIKRKDIVCVPTVSFVEALTDAVAKSGGAMLTMTAFVVFFSQLVFFLTKLLNALSIDKVAVAILVGALEVTLGCSDAAALGSFAGKICAAIACAWGGLSVHMQTLAICAPCNSHSLAGKIFFLRALITVCTAVISALAASVTGLY